MFAYSLQQLSELDDTGLDRMMKNDSTFGKFVQKIKDFFYDFVSLINGEDADTIRMRNYARKMADKFNQIYDKVSDSPQNMNGIVSWYNKDSTLEGLSKIIEENVLKSYGITKVHDYIHVQKKVKGTLSKEGYFNHDVYINESSGMEIEFNEGSIDEAFSSGTRYGSMSRFYKILKLATIRAVPQVIVKGNVISDNNINTKKLIQS